MKMAEKHVLPFWRVKRYEQPLFRSHNCLNIKDRSTKTTPYGKTHMLISKKESKLLYLFLVLWYRPLKMAENHVLPFCRIKRYEQPLLRSHKSLSITDKDAKIAPYVNTHMLI